MASEILEYFQYGNLPDRLRTISAHFAGVAQYMDEELPSGAEKSTCLRKLLEAKDAGMRAALKPKNLPLS